MWRRAFSELGGIRLFRKNYLPDRLPEYDASDRAALASFGGCIACGRCDAGEAARTEASGGRHRGVMHFVLTATRSTPDFDASERLLEHLPESVLEEKEASRTCPTGVPFVALARFVRKKAEQEREMDELAA